MTNQSSTTSRPLVWEDEAPAESRFRRMQQAVPRTGRALPGMPFEMQDPDGDDPPRSDWRRLGAQRSPWWRPASTFGRVSLTLSALIVLGGLTAAGVLLKTYLQRDARFRIAGASNIQATGLTQVTRAQMLPVFGEDIGRNIFFVPLSERRKELEAIPWIERATVMRMLPNQIRVQVVERQPVAFTRHGQQIGLVDASGVLLDMPAAAMAAHHYSFPVVTGIDPGDRPASRQARMAMYGRLITELDANNQRYSEQISEIDLTDPEDARVLMPEQGADILAHFGEDHFLDRYQRYKQHIAEWRQQYPKLAAVDLRYEHQVVLEMASGASQPQPDVAPDAAKATAGATAPAKPDSNAVTSKPAVANKPVATSKPAVTGKPPVKDGASTNKPSVANKSAAATKPVVASKPAVITKPAAKNGVATSIPGKKVPGNAVPAKSAKSKPVKKSSTSSSAKAKTAAAKARAARDKKRVQSKSAALNANKKKPTPATHPVVAAGQ